MIFSLLIVCSSISQIRLSLKCQSWSQKKKLSKTFKLVQINKKKKKRKMEFLQLHLVICAHIS